MLKPGARLKSAVCEAEVMIIKAGGGENLTCGGVAMSDAPESSTADAEQMHGCLIGKRYVTQDETIEVLCVKSGDGSLHSDGEELMTKDTKKLPSSD